MARVFILLKGLKTSQFHKIGIFWLFFDVSGRTGLSQHWSYVFQKVDKVSGKITHIPGFFSFFLVSFIILI